MRAHSFLWHYLWIAPHALQFIVASVMLRRGLWREFPVFFAYTLFTVRSAMAVWRGQGGQWKGRSQARMGES